jgi:large subunit ribosomal protein L10
MKSHTSKWKKTQLAELSELVKKFPSIAVADINSFPANLFAEIRKKLQGKAVVKVSKVRLVQKALQGDKAKAVLNDFVHDSVAVLFTEMDPFELFSFVKKNRGKIGAKAGAIAPENIVIPAMDTGLPPGPALSDLKAAGLNVRIQGATIHIMEDKVVAKAGEQVSKAVAGTLSKLGIKPLKVGLNIVAVFDKNLVYKKDVLDIDTEKIFNDFRKAYLDSLALAVSVGYFTKESVEIMLKKAAIEAIVLDAKIKEAAPKESQVVPAESAPAN